MSLNLYNPIQEQLNILRDMRRYHQEMQDADIVASFNVQFADSLEVVESESVPVQNVRKLSHKQCRAKRRVQNARHKQSDRLHGKSVFSYEYKENGVIKTQILPDNMRSKSTWTKTLHEWGDPDGLKGRVPRTQSVHVHKDTVPVPEQEPTYIGFYGTLEVRKGITVTMEWNVPEAVKGDENE